MEWGWIEANAEEMPRSIVFPGVKVESLVWSFDNDTVGRRRGFDSESFLVHSLILVWVYVRFDSYSKWQTTR